MVGKTKLALAALLTLGIASTAQGGCKDEADSTESHGVAPLGQSLRSGGSVGEAFSSARRSGSTIGTEGKCQKIAVGDYWAACPPLQTLGMDSTEGHGGGSIRQSTIETAVKCQKIAIGDYWAACPK